MYFCLVPALWLVVSNILLEKSQTTYMHLTSPALLDARSQRLHVCKFLGPNCFMLILFTLVKFEISIDNVFETPIGTSAELSALAAFIFFIIQNSSVGSQKTCFL